MSKSPDIRRSFIRYAIAATALFVIFLFVKRDNIIRWIQAGFTLKSQEKQIELLRQKNEDLDRKIELMSTNKDSLETFSREEFYFAAPGDDVYLTGD